MNEINNCARGATDPRSAGVRASGLALVVIALTVLVTWGVDAELLRAIAGGGLRMKANVAFALLCAGVALVRLAPAGSTRRRPGALPFALVVTAIGALTLIEYALDPPWSIDQLLTLDASGVPVGGWTEIAFYRPLPGRMAPYTAVTLLTAGAALCLLALGRLRDVSCWLGAICIVLASVIVVGLVWNVTERWLPPVPLTTALASWLLGLGACLAATSNAPAMALRRRTRIGIEARVLAASLAVTVLLLIGGRFTYRAGDDFAAASEQLSLHQDMQIRVGEARAALTEAESSQRAYLLTGASHFRDDCARFEDHARSAVNELLRGKTDPRDSDSLRAIRALVDERLRLLDEVAATFESHGLDAARKAVAQGGGTVLMARLEGLLDTFEAVQAQHVAGARGVVTHSRRVTLVAWMGTLAGTIGILAFMFAAVRREMMKRGAAQAALAASIEELEGARTAAEAANRAKSSFLAAMSHEIRTPMNGVIGMVEVLAHTRLSADQREVVGTIRDSGNALLQVIDEILDFSKIESGRITFEREPFALADMAEGVCRTLMPLATAKDVDVQLYVEPTLPDMVIGDPTRVRQLLYNLVGNAIKFAAFRDGRRGEVHVCLESMGAPFERLRIRVTDNGIGMNEDVQARLFSPFTQAEASTTRRFGGTGLGLAICKRLVNLMGGRIGVTSAPGAGATFEIVLPLEAARGSVRSDIDLSGLECIVVDGPAMRANDACSYLEHAGAQVDVVAAGSGGPDRALARPDTIVVRAEADSELEWNGPGLIPLSQLVVSSEPVAPSDIARQVVLPLTFRRRDLLRGVALLAGRGPPDREVEPGIDDLGAGGTPPTVTQARARGELLLVAEDDEVNQKVILRQLALLGHAAEVAGDGLQALQLWRSGHYAALLTDLHMPGLDGYALARAIRADEPADRRSPIVALSADALIGVQNQARAAGIDICLTKPVQLHRLRAALGEVFALQPGAVEAQDDPIPKMAARGAPDWFDQATLATLIGDEDEVAQAFLEDFVASLDVFHANINLAMTAGRDHQVTTLVHRMKSTSRAFGACTLGERCSELEDTLRAGGVEDLPRDARAVCEAIGPTRRAVSMHLASVSERLRTPA